MPVEAGIGAAVKLPFIQTSILTDLLYNTSMASRNGQELRFGVTTHLKWININAGTSIAKNRNAKSMGFSFNYRRWVINYGIYFHENAALLGTPEFLDVRHYF